MHCIHHVEARELLFQTPIAEVELQKRLETGNAEREQIRKETATAQKLKDQKVADLTAQIAQERADRRKVEEDSAAKLEKSG